LVLEGYELDHSYYSVRNAQFDNGVTQEILCYDMKKRSKYFFGIGVLCEMVSYSYILIAILLFGETLYNYYHNRNDLFSIHIEKGHNDFRKLIVIGIVISALIVLIGLT